MGALDSTFGQPGPKTIMDVSAEGKQLVQIIDIPAGDAGTEATLNVMGNLSLAGARDPRIILLAQKIVGSNLGSKNYRGEIEALHEWVKTNITYQMDSRNLEWVQSPVYTAFARKCGDCDCTSTLLGALAGALGHGWQFVAVKGDPSRPTDFSHVYARLGYRTSGNPVWLSVDATQNVSAGWEPPPEKVWGTMSLTVAEP